MPKEIIVQFFIEGGLSTEEIAKQFGVTSETIRNRLHEAGIELERGGYRWSGEGREGIGRPTLEISFESLDALYVHQRMSAEEIANLYNCDPETIRRKLHAAGITMKPGPRRR